MSFFPQVMRAFIRFLKSKRQRIGVSLITLLIPLSPAVADISVAINYGASWKWNIPTSDPGTSWRGTGYNDSGWASGPGLLGFDTDLIPAPGLQTTVGAANNGRVTYLFRKTFTYNGNPAGIYFATDQIVDDGVRYYLNGNLLGAVRVSANGAWDEGASPSVTNAAEEINCLTGAATGLINGSNVLCAEVHNNGPGGSDMVFGAKLTLFKPGAVNMTNWRTQHFGTSANSGNGADTSDIDLDGLKNIVEYALDTDPNKPTPAWGNVKVEGGNLTLIYTRRKAATDELTFSALWMVNAADAGSSAGVTTQVIGDNGTFQTVRASVPTGADPKKFFKLNVTLTPTPSAPCWKTFMMTYVGEETWSDGQTYYLNRANVPGRPLPPAGVTVTNIAHIKAVVDTWAALGGTHISFPIGWDETEVALGQFDFRKLDWIFAYATSKGIKCNVIPWPLLSDSDNPDHQYDTAVSWKYQQSDMPRDMQGNKLQHFMNFHSPKISNYYRWLHALGAYLAPHWNAGAIGYVSVVVTREKEMHYTIITDASQTDFHPDAIAAYNTWHQSNYGAGAPYPQQYISGNTDGKRFYKFKTETLVNFLNTSNGILKQYAPFRCVWDAGSFTDNLANRNAWGALAGQATSVDGYKHNPDIYYPAIFDTRAALGVKGWASIKWTNSDTTIADENERKIQLLSQMKASIDAGANDISFAFYDQTGNPSVMAFLAAVVQNMKTSGHWNKPVPAPVTSGTQINITLSNVIQNGYGNYHAPFNAAYSSSGIYPNIKVTNDLP